MRKDTVTAANKQLPKNLYSVITRCLQSLPVKQITLEKVNCTLSQTTTAPERNLSENTIYNMNDGSFYTQRTARKKNKTGTGVNSQCV